MYTLNEACLSNCFSSFEFRCNTGRGKKAKKPQDRKEQKRGRRKKKRKEREISNYSRNAGSTGITFPRQDSDVSTIYTY